jgi:hypothetical protein
VSYLQLLLAAVVDAGATAQSYSWQSKSVGFRRSFLFCVFVLPPLFQQLEFI